MNTYKISDLADPGVVAFIRDKHVLIRELNTGSKLIFKALLQIGIHVDGFILSKNDKETIGMKYLNKPVYQPADIESYKKNVKKYIILETGKRKDIQAGDNNCQLVRYLWATKEILILGDHWDPEMIQLFKELGITLLFLITQPKISDENLDSKSRDSLKQYLRRYPSLDILISAKAKEICAHYIDKLAKSLMPDQRMYYYDKDEFSFKKLSGTKTTYLHYLITKEKFGKKLVLIGNKEEVLAKKKIFDLLDVPITASILTDGKVQGNEFVSIYDLLYTDLNKVILISLKGAEKFIQDAVYKAGIPANRVIRYSDIRCALSRVMFDPTLGYNIKGSINEVVENHLVDRSEVKEITIGVLGGSTTDTTYFAERSWPEFLVEYATEKGIPIKVYSGAVRGYTSSLELQKLIRDMVPMHFDYIISYSGINEQPGGCEENPFISHYQKDIFKAVAESKLTELRSDMDAEVCYGINNTNTAERWILNERMMHAICQSNGIKFYALLQPSLLSKVPFTVHEREVFEHWFMKDKQERFAVLSQIAHQIKKWNLPWMLDYRNIFNSVTEEVFIDGAHVLEQGNRIIASRVLNLICHGGH